jgi:hypothetical protein
MLPKAAREAISRVTPKINPDLGNGLAVKHLEGVEQYIDAVWRSVAADFPPALKYLGPVKYTPNQEFREETRTKGGRQVFDMAQSDVYMVGYKFQVGNEEPFVRPLYLPFCRQAGTIHLSGTRYVISPVLSDRVISKSPHQVFLRLPKARVIIERTSYRFRANGKADIQSVAYGKIHHNKDRGPASAQLVKAQTSLVHYLLCKYGYTEMFTKYVGYVPKIISVRDVEQYPQDQYVVCRSFDMKPATLKGPFSPSDIAFVVHRDNYTPLMQTMMAGLFYVIDHFPDRVTSEHIERLELWRTLLGHLIWASNLSAGRLLKGVNDHFASLDGYHDVVTSDKLKTIGLKADSFYDLLFIVLKNFDEWQLNARESATTMFGKELSVLTFVLSDIVSAINTFYFKLGPAAEKPLTTDSVLGLMRDYFRPKLIYFLNRNHGELSTTGTSGDNMALRITNLLIPQSSSTKTGKSAESTSDPSIQLDASIAAVGGYACLPKSAPDGRSRLNLYGTIDATGFVTPNEKIIKLVEETNKMIMPQ